MKESDQETKSTVVVIVLLAVVVVKYHNPSRIIDPETKRTIN